MQYLEKHNKNYYQFKLGIFSLCTLFLFSHISEGKNNKPKNIVIKKKQSNSKLTDKELLFALTFDKGSTDADFATGNPKPMNLRRRLRSKNFIKGFDKKKALNYNSKEGLRYSVLGNINPVKGTLIFWMQPVSYRPNAVRKGERSNTHKPYVMLNFENSKGDKTLQMYFYQYFSKPVVGYFWKSSSFDPNFSRKYRYTDGNILKLKKGQWIHISASWSETEMKIYLNGELRNTIELSEGFLRDVKSMKIDAKKSFIGVRTRLFKPFDDVEQTAVDDLKIYRRALTDNEVKSLYKKALNPKLIIKEEKIAAEFDGVETGGEKTLNKVLATLNFYPLGMKWEKLIADGHVKVNINIQTPSGKKIDSTFDVEKMNQVFNLEGIDEAGFQEVNIQIFDNQGNKEQYLTRFERPATPWFGNDLGKVIDKVPAPWKAPELSKKNNKVKILNRIYTFRNNPLPIKVTHKGDSLLKSPPKLLVFTEDGLQKIDYKITKKTVKPAFVLFEGNGKSKTFSIDWSTKIAFDGLISVKYKINGSPTIVKLQLAWTVKKKFSTYLMTPLLKEGKDEFFLKFPGTGNTWHNENTVWLSSTEKGFAWIPEHDANWIFENNQRPIHIKRNRAGATVTLTMINKKLKLPEGIDYHAMFIATPAKDLPALNRNYFLSSNKITAHSRVNLRQNQGQGMQGVFSLLPADNFGKVMDEFKKAGYKNIAIYDGVAYNDSLLEGRYFFKTWKIPGVYGPGFYDARRKKTIVELDNCPNTSFTDLKIYNLKKLLDHPKEMYKMIYYDLSIFQRCSNVLHGCGFLDKFGRKIAKIDVLGMRELMLRTRNICHQDGKDFIAHGWSQFNPAAIHFADYVFPGEQYAEKPQMAKAPYYYSDHITDGEYRSELNQQLKGTSIIFLPNLKRANKRYGTTEHTMAMLTKLLLNDIQVLNHYADYNLIEKVWSIKNDFKLNESKVKLYYKQTKIKTDNKNIVITYYKCPEQRTLAIIGNISKVDQEATINLSSFNKKIPAEIIEKITGEKYSVRKNKLKVKIPARHFRMIGF